MIEMIQGLISRGHKLEDILCYSLAQTRTFYEVIQEEKLNDYKTIIELIGGNIKL